MKAAKHQLKESSDFELIDLILKSGDSDLFGELYDRYANKVYRKVCGMIKDAEIGKDLTHDILVKAFLSLSEFERRSSFSTWLYRITYTKSIDYLREKQKHQQTELEENLEAESEIEKFEEAELLNLEINQLKILLDKISNDEKMILLMHYQEDMSIKEIAETLELGTSAVKMRLKRTRDKLKNLHKKLFEEELI